MLGGLSKAFFGYGLADYAAGEKAMIASIQEGYKVFEPELNAKPQQKDAFAANVRYLREALAQVRSQLSIRRYLPKYQVWPRLAGAGIDPKHRTVDRVLLVEARL